MCTEALDVLSIAASKPEALEELLRADLKTKSFSELRVMAEKMDALELLNNPLLQYDRASFREGLAEVLTQTDDGADMLSSVVASYEDVCDEKTLESIVAEAGPSFATPEYYERPFHAYDEGNLCWEHALQPCRGFGAHRCNGAHPLQRPPQQTGCHITLAT